MCYFKKSSGSIALCLNTQQDSPIRRRVCKGLLNTCPSKCQNQHGELGMILPVKFMNQ